MLRNNTNIQSQNPFNKDQFQKAVVIIVSLKTISSATSLTHYSFVQSLPVFVVHPNHLLPRQEQVEHFYVLAKLVKMLPAKFYPRLF